MSPSLLSSESSGPCSRFITGAGRKGNRCFTCRKKERHHHSTTILPSPQAAPSSLPPHSSGPTDSPDIAPQTTIAPTLTTDSTVQAIINRYGAGGTGMQLRPRTTVTPVPAKSEASSGFRKNVVSSSFPKVRIPDLLWVQMLLLVIINI